MAETDRKPALSAEWTAELASLLSLVRSMPPAEFPVFRPDAILRVSQATLDEADLVLDILRLAFAEHEGALDPPSTALDETVADVRNAMLEGGNLLARIGDEAVASARFRLTPDHLYVGRLAVLPSQRGRGIASAVMRAMESIALTAGRTQVALGTRLHLAGNVALYRKLGYEITKSQTHPRGTDTIVWFTKRLDAGPESNTS